MGHLIPVACNIDYLTQGGEFVHLRDLNSYLFHLNAYDTEEERRVTPVRTFEVCVPTHVHYAGSGQ